MRKKLYVDGVDLSTFGLYISGQGTFGSGAKEYTYYNVPGRDGAVLGVNSRLENVSVTYPGFIYAQFDQNMRDLRSFLLSRSGYVRIEDDYDNTHFRMGVFEEPISPDVTPVNDAGRFDLVFNCLPQRWLKSGDTPLVLTADYDMVNPTQFAAKPFLRVYGTGRNIVQFNRPDGNHIGLRIEDAVSTDLGFSYVDIDCETMQAYNGDTNLNQYVYFFSFSQTEEFLDFIWLYPGTTEIGFPGTEKHLEITPRFWEA